MNLHVNLILDSEKRSGSLVSSKFILRVIAAGVPVLIGLLIAGLVMLTNSAREGLRSAKAERDKQEKVYQAAVKLQQELKETRKVAEALDGWGASRCDWYALLRQLQEGVPPSIQLVRLTATEVIGRADNVPARISGMYLNGKVVGGGAEAAVQALESSLKNKPVYTNYAAQVIVKRFEAAEGAADKDTRVFDIECLLAPRKISKSKAGP